MVIPFFTSYLVRVYSWQIFLSDNGIINALLAKAGLGPFGMLNSVFGMMVGYLTLSLPLVVLLQLFSLMFVDRTLIEAAHNLRCGRLRTVFEVVVPGGKGRPRHRGAVLLHPHLRRFRQPALSRWRRSADAVHPDHRHHQVRPAMAARGGHRADDDRNPACRGIRGGQLSPIGSADDERLQPQPAGSTGR